MAQLTARSSSKLKTNLLLAIQRIKLVAKKKAEIGQKFRREIADYLVKDKVDRAQICAEQLIREDYFMVAMDIVEMYCTTVLARFAMLEQIKTLEKGLAEAVSSLLWAAPRLQSEVKELKVIAKLLTTKYGTRYASLVRDSPSLCSSVNERLMLKLSEQRPPKVLVERYLFEIASTLGVPYKGDSEIFVPQDSRYGDGSKNVWGMPNLPLLPPEPSGSAKADDHVGEFILPDVPSFSEEDTDCRDAPGERNKGPSGEQSDHQTDDEANRFDDLKRRFAFLKQKK